MNSVKRNTRYRRLLLEKTGTPITIGEPSTTATQATEGYSLYNDPAITETNVTITSYTANTTHGTLAVGGAFWTYTFTAGAPPKTDYFSFTIDSDQGTFTYTVEVTLLPS